MCVPISQQSFALIYRIFACIIINLKHVLNVTFWHASYFSSTTETRHQQQLSLHQATVQQQYDNARYVVILRFEAGAEAYYMLFLQRYSRQKKTNFFLYYDFSVDENDNNNHHNNKNGKMEWKRKRKDILTLEYERHHVVQRPTDQYSELFPFIHIFCHGYDVIKQKAALYVLFISKRIVKCRD